MIASADIEFAFFSISSAYTCSEQMDDRVWGLLSNTPVYFAHGEGDYPSRQERPSVGLSADVKLLPSVIRKIATMGEISEADQSVQFQSF